MRIFLDFFGFNLNSNIFDLLIESDSKFSLLLIGSIKLYLNFIGEIIYINIILEKRF